MWKWWWCRECMQLDNMNTTAQSTCIAFKLWWRIWKCEQGQWDSVYTDNPMYIFSIQGIMHIAWALYKIDMEARHANWTTSLICSQTVIFVVARIDWAAKCPLDVVNVDVFSSCLCDCMESEVLIHFHSTHFGSNKRLKLPFYKTL